jgi:hypothetical protein
MKKHARLPSLCFSVFSTIVAQSPVDTHQEAAKELVALMNLERTMVGGAAAMTDAMIQGNAPLAPYREVIMEWAKGYMTWDNIRSEGHCDLHGGIHGIRAAG